MHPDKLQQLIALYEGLPSQGKSALIIACGAAAYVGAALAWQELRTDWRTRRMRRGLEFFLYGPIEELQRGARVNELMGLMKPLYEARLAFDRGDDYEHPRSLWEGYTAGADNLIRLEVLLGRAAPERIATIRALGILNDKSAREAWRKREAFLTWLVHVNPRLATLARNVA